VVTPKPAVEGHLKTGHRPQAPEARSSTNGRALQCTGAFLLESFGVGFSRVAGAKTPGSNWAFGREQKTVPKVLNLNRVIRDQENLLRRLIAEDIRLETVLNPDLGLVRADPSQILQVLMNLAANRPRRDAARRPSAD
jgi:hypothetical protein